MARPLPCCTCVATKKRHPNRNGQLSEFKQESNTESQQESNTDSQTLLHVRCQVRVRPDIASL